MYPVAVVLEDFETSSMTVKFHSVSVQFMVEITGAYLKFYNLRLLLVILSALNCNFTVGSYFVFLH